MYGNRVRSNPQSVQKLLDENVQLIQAIVDYQNKGKPSECVQYQQLLHKNLMYLASLADTGQNNIPAMIPPPPQGNQVASGPLASVAMGGVPSNNVPANLQDRKVLGGTTVDQGSPGMPNTISQVISSSASQMSSGMHAVPVVMTTGAADGNSSVQYGGNMNMSSQPLDAGTPPVTGYPANVNQMMATNMTPTSQSIMPGQQQGYMPNMHTTRLQQHSQGQQFMMQQGVGMVYNRPPVQQMHPSQAGHQPQQVNQPQQQYMGNQVQPTAQPTPSMVPYQQAPSSYDPYNPIQHINTTWI